MLTEKMLATTGPGLSRFAPVISLSLMLTSVCLSVSPGVAADAQRSVVAWQTQDPGRYSVGFRLTPSVDLERRFESGPSSGRGRPIRIYLWYPAEKTGRKPLCIADYARMAADDFGLIPEGTSPDPGEIPLPVPLARGLEEDRIPDLLKSEAAAVLDARPLPGPFPLLIVGQGLYYESPLSLVVLCEYLAAHGYVAATCPLMGTHMRLANRDEIDVETQTRDLEFVMSRAQGLPFADPDRLGVVGYDMGGMAGLILVMRNPAVDAFVSLDSGILYRHFLGIPRGHPQYDERRFRIPWLHMTQARIADFERPPEEIPLVENKPYGDTYILWTETANHGEFTSYADFGVGRALAGYWGPIEGNARAVSRAIRTYTRVFLDAYLKGDADARRFLQQDPSDPETGAAIRRIERRTGEPIPPYPDELVQLIIRKGAAGARPEIDAARAAYPDEFLFEENTLNWLGYHFLYWWGREDDAVGVFDLVTDIFPESANAYDSRGEAYAVTGDREKAIASYRRSLELNPENRNAVQALERLEASE